MILIFLISMSGLAVNIRTSGSLFGQGLISKQGRAVVIIAIGGAVLGLSALVFCFIPSMACRWLLLWVLQMGLFLAMCYLPLWLLRRAEDLLRHSMARLFTSLLLSMKSGKSYRNAIAHELRLHTRPEICAFLEEVDRRLNFKSQNRPLRTAWLSKCMGLIDEFVEIDREPHFAIKRLEFAREKYQRLADLSLKINQAQLQARVQSAVMVCIYLACLIWALSRGEGYRSPRLLIFCSFWFAIGCFWIQRIGGKRKWIT